MAEKVTAYDEEGNPLEGLTPSWFAYVDATTGDPVLPQPTVIELGGGLYKFTPTEGIDVAGILDLGEDASPRYYVLESSTVVTFGAFGFVDDALVPLEGLAPTWSTIRYVADGAAYTPQPAIVELGGGLYRAPVVSHPVAGVVDLGEGASPRFVYYDSEAPGLEAPSFSWTTSIPPATTITGGDFALEWSDDGSADLVIEDDDLTADPGMRTAVLISLFLDRRAEDEDEMPAGDGDDRRGWWGDEFAATEGDRIGSRLWLLARGKRTGDVVPRAEEFGRQALAWMVEDKVAERVDVTAETTKAALILRIVIHRPGAEAVAFRFSHVWASL